MDIKQCMLKGVENTIFKNKHIEFKEIPNCLFKMYSLQNIFQVCENNFQFTGQLSEKDDIIKGVYEGGFKLWECTQDLLNYMEQNQIDFTNKNVIDVGCGQGFLGIYALLKNSRLVVFNDFNIDVLQYSTLPNICKNLQMINQDIQQTFDEKIAFIDGDWTQLNQKLQNQQNDLNIIYQNYPISLTNKNCFTQLSQNNIKFDIMLMSEVIYNEDNYRKIVLIIDQLLEKQGFCLLASKIYYYGVGGSLLDFLEYIEQFPQYQIQSVWKLDTKKTNKREIIKIIKIL